MRTPGFGVALGLAGWSCTAMSQAQDGGTAPGKGGGEIVAPTVRVTAPRIITPIPGVTIQREQTTTNVQSATARELKNAQSTSVTDFMNGTMQSVSVNDYQGNPFQQDLVFRGFAASPLIGTPQGLSVYVDGVRVNEPFGEVVNWDLIPVNAIDRMDLMPGSDPLFGLNTLGGALAISTRSGFTYRKTEASVLGGSWGRRQAKASVGGNNGTLAGFAAVNFFDENGWRRNSPSSVRQAFGRVDVQGERGSATLTGLHAHNSLIGNGLVPYEQYRQDPRAVFTSPDETGNRVNHVNASARLDFTETLSMGAQTYYRKFEQKSVGGDVWEDFKAASARLLLDCNDGLGSTTDGAIGVDLPGCPGLMPNGVFNIGRSSQTANGMSWQVNSVTGSNQFVAGVALDMNRVDFRQGQQLGFVSDNRDVVLRPETYNDLFLIPLISEVQRNNLNGGADTGSLFLKDIWSVQPNLHLNAGLRYTRSRVTNQLISDRPIPLYQFDESLFRRLQPRCGAEKGDIGARYYCSSGDFTYESLNPSFGVSWLPRETLNLYANWSKGSRVPSTIELGCARDREAERLAGGGGKNTGKSPGCSVPTALTSDPYLPQVISYTSEVGVRGTLSPQFSWNASVYQTNLANDIMFVSLGSRNRGVFDTFGKTRRRGLELGFEASAGRHSFRGSWSHIDATFESRAEVVNVSNSSSSKEVGKVNTFVIEPGDRIPGIPRDALRLAWRYEMTDRFNFGLSMIAHSWSYVRGNENNEHAPVGTDSNGAPTSGTLDPTITVEPGRRYVGPGRIPGYAIVNLVATYEVTRQFQVGLRVDNLFDRSYVTAGGLALNSFTPTRWGVRDGAGFNYNSNDWTHSTFVGPGAPRALWLTATYVFDTPGSR